MPKDLYSFILEMDLKKISGVLSACESLESSIACSSF